MKWSENCPLSLFPSISLPSPFPLVHTLSPGQLANETLCLLITWMTTFLNADPNVFNCCTNGASEAQVTGLSMTVVT